MPYRYKQSGGYCNRFSILLFILVFYSSLSAQTIDPSFYELSFDGKILLKWKGDIEEVNMSSDPTLSRVEEIAPFAFAHIDTLGRRVPDGTIKKLYLSPALRRIGYMAVWAKSLKELFFSEGLQELAPMSFVELGITHLSLPSTLKKAEGAFYACRYIEHIFVSPESPYYSVEEGFLVNLERRSISLYPSGLLDPYPQLPDNITAIEEGAFAQSPYIERIIVPEGVQSIGVNAFSDCPSLVKIDFPTTLKNLKEKALWYSAVDTLIFRNSHPSDIDGPLLAPSQFRPRILAIPAGARSIYLSNKSYENIAEMVTIIDDALNPFIAGNSDANIPFYLVDNDLYLNLSEEISTARLFDKEGKIVRVFQASGTYNLSPGIYFLQIGRSSYKIVIPQYPLE